MDTTKIETKFPKMQGKDFIFVKASKLSKHDDFMRHTPQNKEEERLKAYLFEVMESGIADFYCPPWDYVLENVSGEEADTSIGGCYNWWKDAAVAFMPSKGSRLGTMLEYVAFIGTYIKDLISEGCSVDTAWRIATEDYEQLWKHLNVNNNNNISMLWFQDGYCNRWEYEYTVDDLCSRLCFHHCRGDGKCIGVGFVVISK